MKTLALLCLLLLMASCGSRGDIGPGEIYALRPLVEAPVDAVAGAIVYRLQEQDEPGEAQRMPFARGDVVVTPSLELEHRHYRPERVATLDAERARAVLAGLAGAKDLPPVVKLSTPTYRYAIVFTNPADEPILDAYLDPADEHIILADADADADAGIIHSNVGLVNESGELQIDGQYQDLDVVDAILERAGVEQ